MRRTKETLGLVVDLGYLHRHEVYEIIPFLFEGASRVFTLSSAKKYLASSPNFVAPLSQIYFIPRPDREIALLLVLPRSEYKEHIRQWLFPSRGIFERPGNSRLLVRGTERF